MLASLLNSLFGCSHQRTTFPLTPSRKMATTSHRHGTYVVCLDCGKEFPYDWKQMKMVDAAERSSRVHVMREPVRTLAKTA